MFVTLFFHTLQNINRLTSLGIFLLEHVTPRMYSISIDFSNDVANNTRQTNRAFVTKQRNNYSRVVTKIFTISLVSYQKISPRVRETQKRNRPVLKCFARQLGKQRHTDRVR